MYLLINDFMQSSDAPEELISPALADACTETPITVTLDAERTFDCVGIGYTDATTVTVNSQPITITNPSPYPDSYKNGLYLITSVTSDTITISHNGTYLGRLAVGLKRLLGCAPSREPGFWTTEVNRETLSGQVIPGAGGISGRQIDVDFRYKFTQAIFNDIEVAYASQLSKGFPLFMAFTQEASRMPWARLYGKTDNQLLFQSSVNRFLYSRLFRFEERY